MAHFDAEEIHRGLADMGVFRFLDALGIKYRRGGARARIRCPIHNGSDANVSVGVDAGRIKFVCFSGCGGVGGDGLALIAAVHGLDVRRDFGAVLDVAASIAGVAPSAAHDRAGPRRVPYEDPAIVEARRRAAEGVERVVGTLLDLCPLDGDGLRYMTAERGLSIETCRAARVGFVGDAGRVRRTLLAGFSAEVLDELGIVYRGERFAFDRHPLLFPIVFGGRVVYVQGRALAPVEKKQDRWRSMRGSVPTLFGVDALADASRRVVIAEGPIDTMSAREMWPDRAAVGIIGAGGFKDEWLSSFRGRDVMLALDPDDAGDRGAEKVRRALLTVGARVRRLRPPDGGFDLNRWLITERAA